MANNEPITLRNWTMFVDDKKLFLSGIADSHPKLGINVELAWTSSVISIEENKSYVMTCRTKNSVYKLDWRFMSMYPTENLASPQELECPETVRDKYIAYLQIIKTRDKRVESLTKNIQFYRKLIAEGEILTQKIEEKLENELLEKASQYSDCIYMNISSVSKGNKIAYNINGNTGIVEPLSNDNTIVISVEYKTDNKSGMDVHLGYYAGMNSMDIFDISDNVKSLVIHSNRRAPLTICGDYTVNFDETIIIESNDLRG